MRTATLAVLCCLVAFAPLAHADNSVEARLKERGIKFEQDEDGDYRVVYNYKDEGRTQLVFVGGGTESIRGMAIREVFSPAGNASDDRIDGARALELLAANRRNKLGAWEFDGKTLLYVIKLSDDASAAELEAAMDVAANEADDMEVELSGKKDAY